jgi:hypothetical protein
MKTLKHRQQWAAFLVATGTSFTKISELTGIEVARLHRWQTMPLFQSLVEEHQENIVAKGVTVAMAPLLADAPENIAFLRGVRDGEFDGEDMEQVKLRVDVAKTLLTHQVPKTSKSDVAITKTTHIVDERRRSTIDADRAEAIIQQPIPLDRAIEDQRE